MTDSDQTDTDIDTAPVQPQLDPSEILAQAAALAHHLQSSGVAFLPAANEANTASLAPRFKSAQPEPSLPKAAPQSPPAKQSSPAKQSTTPSAPAKPAPKIVADAVEVSYQGASLDETERTSQLQLLSQQVAACTRCEKLASCRTNTVFGEGSVTPRIVFFGEGPGADEDRTGRPFVGRAGQLLTKMIEACKFQREDVYILNSVKCRPPGNRNPEPDELSNCREYFEKQIQILQPQYIVCLGAVSSQTLLNSKLSVGRLRGKFHRYFDSKVLVTYHPAYLLRNPAAKKAAWQDLQLMLRDAGLL